VAIPITSTSTDQVLFSAGTDQVFGSFKLWINAADGISSEITTTVAPNFSTITAAVTLGSPHIFGVSFDGVVHKLIVNENVLTNSITGILDTTAADVVKLACKDRTGATLPLEYSPFNGHIAEVIIYTTPLNDVERYMVETALSVKYNIPIGAMDK